MIDELLRQQRQIANQIRRDITAAGKATLARKWLEIDRQIKRHCEEAVMAERDFAEVWRR